MSELYELPEGWEWYQLKDICEFENGDRGKNYPSKSAFVKSGIPVISAKNLNGWTIDKNGLNFITRERFNLIGSGKIKNGDILFCLRGSLGKSALVDNIDEGVIASSLVIVRVTDKSLSQLILYYFNSPLVLDFINKYNNGSAQPNLSAKSLSIFDIPLPPLQEQKRIVAKLDRLFGKIDQAIALHQQNIDEAEALMGSVLDEVFEEFVSATKISLKEITIKIGSGSTPRGGQKSYKTEGISLIRSMNIHDAGFRTKGLAFIDDEQAKKLDNVTIKENDVLLNITGASVARCCIVDKNYLPARVNQHVSIIRLKEAVLSKFLHYYLISPSVKSDLLFSSSGGATREAITKSMLEAFEVPLVSLKTQQKTVQYLDQLSQKTQALKKAQEEKMQSLKELKASILDRAFRGEM